MIDSGLSLKENLTAHYSEFARRLGVRLGSRDLAHETLAELFIKIEAAANPPAPRNPRAYLYRMAINLATDRRRSEARHLSRADVDALLDVPDPSPDALREAEARSEIDALRLALRELPERQREVLLASRLERTSNAELALRYGVSTRTVETDLKRAVEHCSQRLERKVVQRFGPARFRTFKN
ncbi:RNA polymerase sigma factor [Sphingomonas sp. KR3-1]|uniref:RNA polymerase sigma factor n=1 Tax=Sphingomonas sp. KR3-1 TaxID=3156611 RepID=UPI0032B486D8